MIAVNTLRPKLTPTYASLIAFGITHPDYGAFRELALERVGVSTTAEGTRTRVRDVDGNEYEIDVRVAR